jgi:hypothetical protein
MTIAFVTILVLQGAVAGQQPAIEAPASASPGPATSAPAAPAAAAPPQQVREPSVTRALGTFSDDQIRWINRRWSGVGVGFDNGLWGGKYGQSIRCRSRSGATSGDSSACACAA